jgi:hypothetical protein
VDAKTFVDEAVRTGARVIGVSAMIYTTAENIRKVRQEIKTRGLEKRIKLAVGGAVFRLRPELVQKVGAFVEDLDRERVALGKSFGLDLLPVREWCRLACGGEGNSLSEVCRRNPAYEKIKGQKEFRTGYLLEDIPYGLVPMIELGTMQGLAMERMDLMARLGQHLLRDDSFIARGRTLKSLGMGDMSSDQFTRFIETGER